VELDSLCHEWCCINRFAQKVGTLKQLNKQKKTKETRCLPSQIMPPSKEERPASPGSEFSLTRWQNALYTLRKIIEIISKKSIYNTGLLFNPLRLYNLEVSIVRRHE
jgi:hypothetical protein